MFKMNSLSILLLCSWISYSVSTVKIQGSGVVTATHGSNIKLKCDVSGNDTFEAWKNPDNIVVVNSKKVQYTVNGNSHEIKIIDVEAEDGGNWTCTSKEGNSDTTELHVAVSEIPQDSAEKMQYLLKDSPGIIKINILGYPRPTFKWKKNNQEFDLKGRYSTAHNGSLLILNVDLGDKGLYSVAGVQGNSEADVTDITVIVHARPMFNTVRRIETQTLHGDVTFACNATGIPVPVITWKHGSKVVKGDTRHVITTSGLTINTSRLTITNLEKIDVGKYTCVANNPVGTKEQVSSLTVLVPPKIQPISDQEINKGKDLRVYCNVSGDPKPDVKWIKNGNDLPDEQQGKDNSGNLLKIDKVQPRDSGTYECTASNTAVDETGNVIVRNQSMNVDVIYPPEFDPTSSKMIETSPYELAEIKCIANGNPAPSLTLSFGKRNLEGTLRNESSKTSLTVSVNVTKDSLGVYTCVASNRIDDVQRSIKVYIPLDPPKISDVEAECNKVTFKLDPDTKKHIKIEHFVVTLNSSGPPRKMIAAEDISEIYFDNLQENTKYDLSVKQETEIDGFGHTSKEIFTTKVCPLREINKAVVEKNKIDIYWPEATEEIQHYILKYRIKGSEKKWKQVVVEEVTTKLTKLNYGATYELQVFVVVHNKTKAYTNRLERKLSEDTSTDPSTTTKHPSSGTPSKTTKRPGAVARSGKGLSGGAIAAIVIVIILLVLIAVDVFCCFFNQCGVVHMCAATCTGKSRSKYDVDSHNPEEGTELKDRDESKDPEA